jgi:hypothetical protein
MGFVNLNALKKKYPAGTMKENVDNLIEYDIFHCLLRGSITASSKVKSILGEVPEQFLEWIKVCDGGLLFDTVMLSTTEHDSILNLDFDTYEELNSDNGKAFFKLPEGFVIFALRSYGDPLCFDVDEPDGRVYLWNVENEVFDEYWESFEDWMSDEICDAVNLIADDVLEPLGVKLDEIEESDNE